jgi:predicted transcriptional regulator
MQTTINLDDEHLKKLQYIQKVMNEDTEGSLLAAINMTFAALQSIKTTSQSENLAQQTEGSTSTPPATDNEFQQMMTRIKQQPLRRAEPIRRGATAQDLLKFAGTWQGDDLEECLKLVYETRSKSTF